MKKILSIMFYLLVTANLFSQIKIDKVEEDGSRIIISNNSNIYTGWTNAAAINLSYLLTASGLENYQITLCLNEGKMQFEKGRKLLLKFKDNTMMELVNCERIGPADYQYQVTNIGTNYYTFPKFNVSEEELHKIINGEVVKIRIENDIEFFDRDIKKNKFSNGLKKAFDAINSRKTVKNDVYEGF